MSRQGVQPRRREISCPGDSIFKIAHKRKTAKIVANEVAKGEVQVWQTLKIIV